jgi:hypothetical protein
MGAWRRRLAQLRSGPAARGLRAALVAVVAVGALGTRGWWGVALGRSLACTGDVTPSEVMVVENFDPNYLVFERAAALQARGLAARALVPVQASREPGLGNPVSLGIAEVMARQARLAAWEPLPIVETEPIALNAGRQVRDHLVGQGIRSVVLVTPGFRSRRSSLVYHALLDPAGMRVQCVPVFGDTTPGNWMRSWHGVQGVVEELLKLQYYQLRVLPFRGRARWLPGRRHADPERGRLGP